MDRKEAAELLDSLGKKRFAELINSISANGVGRFALFLEVSRIVEFRAVAQKLAAPQNRLDEGVFGEELAGFC